MTLISQTIDYGQTANAEAADQLELEAGRRVHARRRLAMTMDALSVVALICAAIFVTVMIICAFAEVPL